VYGAFALFGVLFFDNFHGLVYPPGYHFFHVWNFENSGGSYRVNVQRFINNGIHGLRL
jgi:hypothetical protein